MRGDDDDFVDGELYLTKSDALKGVPVFTTTGERLGTLEGAVIHQSSGAIASVVVTSRRLFGLLRRRIALPRSALQVAGANGGFVVEWPQRDITKESAAQPIAPLTMPRLDPARGD